MASYRALQWFATVRKRSPGYLLNMATPRLRLRFLPAMLIITSFLPLFGSSIAVRPTIPTTDQGIYRPPSAANEATVCIRTMDWLAPGLDGDDCSEAMMRFLHTDRDKYGQRRFEFLDVNTPQRTRSPMMRTPRRYTIGTCTVAVGILSDFTELLPEEASRRLQKSDVASFQEIMEGLRRLAVTCLTDGKAGWDAVGKDQSLGVFVWATDSHMDQTLFNRPSALRYSPLVLNSTARLGISGSSTS